MLCILHGWLLEGSGSNLWTRSVVRSLCRRGEVVHLVCQENHPERYDFIASAHTYELNGSVTTILERESPYPGRCILHKPALGATLPVFVTDKYEEYARVIPLVDLSTEEVEAYVARNVEILLRIAGANDITVIHANHAVMMPVVAQRVEESTGIPFTVMPHGSDIEYAVKKDDRFLRYASSSLEAAQRIFVIGDEMRERVHKVFNEIPSLEGKLRDLHLGVDTAEFEPVTRSGRQGHVAHLLAAIAPLPRGKSASQETSFLAALENARTLDDLRVAIAPAARYDDKRPDELAERKLAEIDWPSASTLLFVGRLIAWKGIQSLIAALPLVLERNPLLRTVVVGHGPLREPMEALVWALQHGRRDLVEAIISNGRYLDGSADHADRAEDSDGEHNPVGAQSGSAALTDVAAFLAKLSARGELDRYFEIARQHITDGSVVFTGYLTHTELRYLFPCCDVGVFPSVVREAGPLVFLESLASGCFPLGTYFGGMKASIDAVGAYLPAGAGDMMKLDPNNTVADLVIKLPLAIEEGPLHKDTLSRVARDDYDWSSVSQTFLAELRAIESARTLS